MPEEEVPEEEEQEQQEEEQEVVQTWTGTGTVKACTCDCEGGDSPTGTPPAASTVLATVLAPSSPLGSPLECMPGEDTERSLLGLGHC